MSTKKLTRKEIVDYIKWLESNLHKSVFQVSGFGDDEYKSWVGNIDFVTLLQDGNHYINFGVNIQDYCPDCGGEISEVDAQMGTLGCPWCAMGRMEDDENA